MCTDFGESSPTQGEVHLGEQLASAWCPIAHIHEVHFQGISLSNGVNKGFVFPKDFPEEFICLGGKISNSNIKSLTF